MEENLLKKIKEYVKENQIDQFNHKHVNKFLKTSRVWSKQNFCTRKIRLICFGNNQQIASEQNKSTKPHPSFLQEFGLSSHEFILASVLVEKSLAVSETNTLSTSCLKHLREYIRRSKLIQNGHHKRFLKNGLTKSLFEHKLKLSTFISQKQTIKLSAVLFWLMKGML